MWKRVTQNSTGCSVINTINRLSHCIFKGIKKINKHIRFLPLVLNACLFWEFIIGLYLELSSNILNDYTKRNTLANILDLMAITYLPIISSGVPRRQKVILSKLSLHSCFSFIHLLK
jgi:hypothetical protein